MVMLSMLTTLRHDQQQNYTFNSWLSQTLPADYFQLMSLQLLLAYLIDKSYVPFIVKLQYTSAGLAGGEANY